MASNLARKLSANDLSVEAALAPPQLSQLKDLAVPEDWGRESEVLRVYLALHVPLAIGQGRYVWDGKQIVLRAGYLATPAGAPLYLGLTRTGGQWALEWAGARPDNVEILAPADLGRWPELDPGRDVVVTLDRFHEPPLAGLLLVAQQAAVAGAVQWSVRRGLAVRQLRHEKPGYLVPIHLSDRDAAPELVAALELQGQRILVRALMAPKAAYLPARAVVERREDLALWLRDAWSSATRAAEEGEEEAEE
jgi:hypothetical protein